MWSLYKNNEKLEPLIFSNGKTQEDVVNEIVSAIDLGYKVIFLKGVCGTGKSAIALNLARIIGKTSIIVPIKSLQEQYIKDYTERLYVLDKKEERKLKIYSIIGRRNFKCKYLEGNILPNKKKIEKNSKLFDIFEGNRPGFSRKEDDPSCDNLYLPCKIEIKQRNLDLIKEFIKQNPNIKLSNFDNINQVRRMSIAPICPYWSPIFPEQFDLNLESKRVPYLGLEEINFIIHQRKPGCAYYEQYLAYSEADVIIFNSLKYKIETLMNRKPSTELEIIDECDEFLDSFANQEKINLNHLLMTLGSTISSDEKTGDLLRELSALTESIKKEYSSSNPSEIFKLSGTPVDELLRLTLKDSDLLYETEIDDTSYIFHLDKVARIFYDFLEESYFSVEKENSDIIITIVTTNLMKKFQELRDKNKIIVMMSGTIHSEEVLRNIFGLEEFKIIEAETKNQGELIKCRHGYEIDCKYSNFQSEKISRTQFLKTFEKTIDCAKKPVLVHLTSFSDLPSEKEKEALDLKNLPTQFEVLNEQKNDPLGKKIQDFKNKKTNILFTTKCNRGIDFPGEICNSIIISRFPYPNISSMFWKILKRTNPKHFLNFYLDKANREMLQRVYRGLRSKVDRVYLLSPDSRVLDFDF